MVSFRTSDLDAFVATVDRHGMDWSLPVYAARFGDMRLQYDTLVDQDSPPFSDGYMAQQIALYREISGRSLDQSQGELHDTKINALIGAGNPKGLQNVDQIAEDSRVISTMLSLTALQGSPRVLDMGAGHGLSSEVLAFGGCQVHAIDIDPKLGKLSRIRAKRRGLSIRRTDTNFDDLSMLEPEHYHAAFFYQSLHHCLTPWKLIDTLRAALVPDGVIVFAGEPLQTAWWRNWGLRLDPESLYVARRFGWFESGWSHDFISACFSKAGLHLEFFNSGVGGGDIGVATLSRSRRDAMLARAVTLGLRCRTGRPLVVETQFASLTGERADIKGRPGFLRTRPEDGYLLYGPYTELGPGDYDVSLLVAADGEGEGALEVDYIAAGVALAPAQRLEASQARDGGVLVSARVVITAEARHIEFRARHEGPARWHVSLPTVETARGGVTPPGS